MALIATLQFGDNDSRQYTKTYTVSEVKRHLVRSHNRYFPDGPVRCERIEVTVVVPGREDLTLIDWYVNRSVMTGRVVVAMSNDAKSEAGAEREMLFEDAQCFSLTEDYDIDSGVRRRLTISFSGIRD